MKDALAVYVHIPFCPSKCGYCDFNSYAMDGEVVERTVSAIVAEIRNGAHKGIPAKSIFFGGGTPTYLSTEQICRVLDAVAASHPPIDDCEVTSEANPGTLSLGKLLAMRASGFNRLSIGGQSFRDSELIRLGRVHTSADIESAVRMAREAGFANINVDMIFALPGQTHSIWKENLMRAVSLGADHLSLYCLTIEPNTAFYKEHRRGLLQMPDDEMQTSMYDMAVAAAEVAGYYQYEISNFARSGFECRHNLSYWKGEEYIAYGPGAVERVGKRRWTHIKHPARYCEAVERAQELHCEEEFLDEDALARERIMLGLRVRDGVDARSVANAEGLDRMCGREWVKVADGRVMLTPTGRHYCNEVIVALF